MAANAELEAFSYSVAHDLRSPLRPRVDGIEVLRRIRADERTKFLPVLILTASQEAEDIARSYELGANAYVRKPVDFVAFAEAVNTLGLFWLLLNEPPPGPRTLPLVRPGP